MIKVLDCTLRDGGYVNNWKFGYENIKTILENLGQSKVDIIECGYLTQGECDYNSTMFGSVSQIDELLNNKETANYVCMINYGDYDVKNLPLAKDSKLTGVRLAFHKKDWKKAIEDIRIIKEKGYEAYVQPMVSMGYDDSEFMELISASNKINADVFYIVDSFGVMKKSDLMRLFYLTNHNLNKNIKLGYHSHNNLQLAYSNAQTITNSSGQRDIIIDMSIMGMGRGAGNLNTELFLEYLNENHNGQYNIFPILQAIDGVVNKEYQLNGWGYSLPHYLSATKNCHPNYATFLEEKNTLTVVEMDKILELIPEEKRLSFDKAYVQKRYEEYQSHKISDTAALENLKKQLQSKDVLLVAPGGSIIDESHRILDFIEKEHPIVISVNFQPHIVKSDYVFYGNIRRYKDGKHNDCKEIITSNIEDTYKSAEYVVNYSNLLNNYPTISDNSAMMLIELLIQVGVRNIYLAGLDGYSNDVAVDYAEKDLALVTKNDLLKCMNEEMTKKLREFGNYTNLHFVTEERKIKL